MNKAHLASQLRQKLNVLLDELQHCATVVQGRDPLVAGSFYERRRRCGKAGCRCASGPLHGTLALSISQQGRSRLIPLAGLDPVQLRNGNARDQSVRAARQRMQRLCRLLLNEALRLQQARRINPRRLREASNLPR